MEIVISGQGKCCAIAGSFAGNFLGDSKTEGLKRVQSYFKVAVSNMSCERRTWTNHESVGLQFSSPFDAVSSHDDGSLLVWIWWTWPEEVSMTRLGLWVSLSFQFPLHLLPPWFSSALQCTNICFLSNETVYIVAVRRSWAWSHRTSMWVVGANKTFCLKKEKELQITLVCLNHGAMVAVLLFGTWHISRKEATKDSLMVRASTLVSSNR